MQHVPFPKYACNLHLKWILNAEMKNDIINKHFINKKTLATGHRPQTANYSYHDFSVFSSEFVVLNEHSLMS